MLPDGSYSDKDKQVGRVLKESDGLYKNACGVIMWMIQNVQPSDYKVDSINDTGNENGESDWEKLLVTMATNH
jgi:hypothetical protein